MARDLVNNNAIYENFKQAHNLLLRTNNDVYRYRQVINYIDFYDIVNGKLSISNRKNIVDAMKKMSSEIDKLFKDSEEQEIFGFSYIKDVQNKLKSCMEKEQK